MLFRLVITVCCKQCTENISSGVGKLGLQLFVMKVVWYMQSDSGGKVNISWRCYYQSVRKISLYERLSISECFPTLELPRSPDVTPLDLVRGDT